MISISITKIIISRVLVVPLFSLVVPLFSLVRKFYPYKIHVMRTDRLGHLAMNTHLFFIRQKKGLIKDINYFLIAPSINNNKKVANKDLLRLHIEYSKSLHNVNLICSNILYFFFSYSNAKGLFKNKNASKRNRLESRRSDSPCAWYLKSDLRFESDDEQFPFRIGAKSDFAR